MTAYSYQRPQVSIPPVEWARRMKVEQQARRAAAAEDRAAHRLGLDWHVIETPHDGFLAIGPGGIFHVSLAQHGRSRVLIAGDVVQIGVKRPGHIPQARKDARRAAKALSSAIGQDIKVFPVLAFVGNGPISVNGLPKDCVITSYRELDKVLAATGKRITPATVEKLSRVARSPSIWPDSTGYTWYQEGSAPGDKGTARG
jgi:hypothetical protein